MSSRARNKLTVKQVAGLTKPGVYSDGGGLYVRVRPSGKSWVYVNTLLGKDERGKLKRQEMGLGSTYDVSLAKAREMAAAARALALAGKDPRGIREQPQTAEERPKTTFGAYAKTYLDSKDGSFRNEKHRQQWHNTLATYAASIADVPIDEVTTDHVEKILLPIWQSKRETASRVRGRIERVLDAAKVKGLRDGDNPARWHGNMKLLMPEGKRPKANHHPALPYAEIASFMRELRDRPAMAARALEFTILTAARSGETRGTTWAEIDLANNVWTVPEERMKAWKEHQVPLSHDAARLLKALRSEGASDADLVFQAQRGGPLSNMAMAQLLKRMDRPDITVHGFRSTFRDWAGEVTQFEPQLAEMALAHTLGKVERAYRRERGLEKRREMMEAWASYCDGLVAVTADTEGAARQPRPSA